MRSKTFIYVLLTFVFVSRAFSQEIIWKEKSSLPLAIRNGSAASCNGKIYFMGGYCESTPERFENKNFEYNTETDTWSEKAKIPTGRSNFTLVSSGNKIFAIGGDPFSGKNEMYIPKNDEWIELTPIPTPRQHVYGTILNNKIYVIGGLQQKGNTTKPSEWSYENISVKNEVYDISTDKWEESAPMPTPRHDSHAISVNGKIYVIGGMGDTSSIWKSLSTVEMYNPQEDKWETKANLPEPRDGFGMSVIEDKIYIVGGFNGENVVKSVLVYDTIKDSWSTASDFPNEKKGAAGTATIKNKIYIIGGCDKNYTANNFLFVGEVINR